MTMINENGFLHEDSIVDEFRFSRVAPSQEQWQALRDYSREAMPRFLMFLERREEHLRELETDLCLLLRLGMPPKQIVILMGISYQHLNILRKRLLKKVYGEEGPARLFDEKIRREGAENHFV